MTGPESRDGEAAEKLRRAFAAVRLSSPRAVPQPPALPEKTARKYPLLQELSAERQLIVDGFSRAQLELRDIMDRMDNDIAAVSRLQPAKPAAARSPRSATEPRLTSPARPEVPSREEARPAPPPPAVPPVASGLKRPLPIAVLLTAAVAFGGYLMLGGASGGTIPLPASSAAGLCLDGEGRRAFFLDHRRQLLFTVSLPEKRVESVVPFPGTSARAMAYDGKRFWSAAGGTIYRHQADNPRRAEPVYLQKKDIGGLAWDGELLWASSGGTLIRYSVSGDSLKEAGGMSSAGGGLIAADEGRIWVLDPASARLSAAGQAAASAPAADLGPFIPEGSIAGFSVSGSRLWVITQDPVRLRSIDFKKLKFK